ncbi:MAG: tyrosine-type recombinase/integrase [Isosphaerales bacterium]
MAKPRKHPEQQPEKPARSKPPIKVAKPDGSRLHVTPQECKAIQKAAGSTGRYPLRDATMIMLGFNHGLRSEELVSVLWEQVNLAEKTLAVVRCKKGSPSTHPLTDDEVKALRKLWQAQMSPKTYVFMTERGGPLTTSAFRKIIARAGKQAGLPMRVHPHMLRHGCGYMFANQGQDTRSLQGYLGHKNIQHTVRYTALSKDRFKGFKPE